MAAGIVLTVVEKLYAALRSEELKEVCSMLGYESQLDELAVTASTIKSVLLDAESKHQELSNEGRDYIERLKEAVYDVEDLLDEFNTMVQKEKIKKGGKISKKVRRFFSHSNRLFVAFNMSHGIKNLRNKLDKIAKDRHQFGLSDVYVPLRRKEGTFSYGSDDKCIGREVDKESIVNMLLGDSKSTNNIGDNVSFVSIIGMGGLGKTALAQLVYNDPRVEKAFKLRLWVCVSEEFVLEQIFLQMLEKNVTNIEELQRGVRKLLEGKRYLLVLDDAWCESRDEWDKLKLFLNLGKKGSKIIVTSRSKRVAKVLDGDLIYELKGLSEDNSWDLFKRFAFKKGEEPMTNDHHLFDIGKEISKKCANVPLAIRVIGSMLYDQDESKWVSLKSANYRDMEQGEKGIIPILKFSYYELSPSLKSCLSYCALFPKDFVIEKKLLIKLWLVHSCLDQPHDCRSKEDVGEEYFSILLNRCFLHAVREDEHGEITLCKMHDLIHDLAKEVAGQETIMLDNCVGQLDNKRNCHLSVTDDGFVLLGTHSSQLCEMKRLRTFLHVSERSFMVDGRLYRMYTSTNFVELYVTAICSHLKRLRVLDLHNCHLNTLPDKLGSLSHLRYLDLSGNHELRVLPKSITKLYNLQVLNLDSTSVRELPWDMQKLVNLRHLILECDTIYRHFLSHIPAGLDSLTCLHTLTNFVVGNEASEQGNICKLRDLKSLVNLRGNLKIELCNSLSCDMANYQDIELIRVMQLKCLCIHFSIDEILVARMLSKDLCQGFIHETLLASLQPHSKLKEIEIERYQGFKLPSWAESLTTSLPNLVKIQLIGFDMLELGILPSMSQLRHLKYLKLEDMPNVEFMESNVIVGPSDDELLFFPSLEELEMRRFPKLKGWWREEMSRVAGEVGTSSVVAPSFPSLRRLILNDCPSLATLPSCPNLSDLELHRCHEALGSKRAVSCHPSIPSSSLSSGIPLLSMNIVEIDNVGVLDYFFGESLGGIRDLSIQGFEGESLSSLAEKCVMHASFIKELEISFCPNLKNLSGIEKHLTSLQSLDIDNCEKLELLNNEEEGALTPWKSLHLLSSLSLSRLPKLINLPKEFRYLTSLQSMVISKCSNLEALANTGDQYV